MKYATFAFCILFLSPALAEKETKAARKPASGGFECTSSDRKLIVTGGDSSAGTWVNEVKLNNRVLVKDKDFKAGQIYKGESQFHFLILDQDLNATVARVETLRNGAKSYGHWIQSSGSQGTEPKSVAITCEFTY